MIDLINKNLNIHQLLKEKLDVFKEIFIEYYGEESREFIEYKFSHLATIGYLPLDDLKSLIRDLEKELSDNIMSKQDFSNIPLDDQQLFDNYRLENYSLMPIGRSEEFINYIKIDKEKRFESYKNDCFDDFKKYVSDLTKEEYDNIWQTGQFPDWIDRLPLWLQNRFRYYCTEEGYKEEVTRLFNNAKPILEELYSGITIDNFEQLLEENPQLTEQLIKTSDTVKNCYDEYQVQKKQYSEYYDLIKESKDLASNLSNKYYKMFILENFDLIPDEDKEEVRELLKTDKLYNLSEKVKFIFGNDISPYNSNIAIEAFSTESEEKITSKEISNYTKKAIISDRIKFFKLNGVDLGDKYESYLQSEEAKRIWPSKERVDKLIESFNSIKNKYNNHLYPSLSVFKKLKAEIAQLGLLSKDDGLDASKYTIPCTCVNPNIINGPNGIELFPLVFVIPELEGKYTDHKIVHELNHVIELSLTDIGENTYDVICGWDTISSTYNEIQLETDTINKAEKRPYELINEIINEIIAQEISELMHNKGIIVADDKEKTSYIGYTSYEQTYFIVKDFYKEFKEAIIKSRHNGNIQILFDAVGKENFEELNELFIIFYENFDSFSYIKACQEFKNNEDTKSTRIIKEILSKRDKILDKMRMHSAMRQSQNEVLQEEKVAQI